MKVFRLDSNGENFQSLVLKRTEQWSLISSIAEGSRPIADWKPVEVTVLRDPSVVSSDLPPSDFPFLSPLDVFSAKAVDSLSDVLQKAGVLLPLYCEEGDYFVFGGTNVLDALDVSRSKLWTLDTGRVVRIDEYCFKSEVLKGQEIFRLSQRPWGESYVTDAFVERIKSAGLVGFNFPQLWSDHTNEE